LFLNLIILLLFICCSPLLYHSWKFVYKRSTCDTLLCHFVPNLSLLGFEFGQSHMFCAAEFFQSRFPSKIIQLDEIRWRYKPVAWWQNLGKFSSDHFRVRLVLLDSAKSSLIKKLITKYDQIFMLYFLSCFIKSNIWW
jgi:hypothetical protein